MLYSNPAMSGHEHSSLFSSHHHAYNENSNHNSCDIPATSCDRLVSASAPADLFTNPSPSHQPNDISLNSTTITTTTYHHETLNGAGATVDMTPQDHAALNLNHPGLSAFAAVSHYPYAVAPSDDDEEGGPDLSVEEVVNAVVERGEYPGRMRQGAGWNVSGRRYHTYSRSVDDPGEDYYYGGEGRYRRQRGTAMVEDEHEQEHEHAMSPGAWGLARNRLSPAMAAEDPDDTRKFYPDADAARWDDGRDFDFDFSGPNDMDYGGFYQMDEDDEDALNYDYNATPQSVEMPIAQDMHIQDHNGLGFDENGNASGEPAAQFGFAIGPDFPITSMFSPIISQSRYKC